MTNPLPAGGHELAARQLATLAAASGGAIELVRDAGRPGGLLISLDTAGIPAGPGIDVRERERFQLSVPSTFPFRPPSVSVPHYRWAGTPHVQWGRTLCLYASVSVDWVPGDGIRGLIDRLMSWVERAAAGTLDPDDQPLHPPVAYSSDAGGNVVVHADLADRVPWLGTIPDPSAHVTEPAGGVRVLFGWCRYQPEASGGRVDVEEWLTLSDAVNRAFSVPKHTTPRHLLVLTVLIDTQIGWEYPSHARDLAAALAGSGFPHDDLLGVLTLAARLNDVLGWATDDAPDPVMVLLGTPSRRIDGQRLAHLAAWRFDPLGARITTLLATAIGLADAGHDDIGQLSEDVRDLAHDWVGFARVHWATVYEQRSEVTRRRDLGTEASWLTGRRVLILGAGAIGAPVAEQITRAGVAELVVIDNGTVTPGILVRQPYTDADIGTPKATALATRLNTLGPRSPVEALVADATALFVGDAAGTVPRIDRFDLVVDATANVATRAALEHARRGDRARWPLTATMVVGHRATRAVVTLSLPGASGSGHDLLRRVAIHGRGPGRSTWSHVVEDLFPDPPRTEPFLPEPGCSAPTFVGSATQLAALSAGMLDITTKMLAAPPSGDPVAPMTASTLRLATRPRHTIGGGHDTTSLVSWPNDLHTTDHRTGYEIRIAQPALATMRAETRRGHRLRGPRVETGGMLLGFFDDATRVVTVDMATGPSPDSTLSPIFFDHGIEGTQEVLDHHRARSGGLIGYVGLWHTHPEGPARPSATDEAAIATLTRLAPRALMVILGGPPPIWHRWRDGAGDPQVYGRVEHAGQLDHRPVPQPARRHTAAVGPAFPGGFRGQAGSDPNPGRPDARPRPWWRWPWPRRQ